LPETQRQILRLTRDVEVTQSIYMQMLNAIQELRIARAGTVGSVRILDEALASTSPISPQISILTLGSGAFGLALSLLYIFAANILRKGVEAPDQLNEVGLAVYATIPVSKNQQKFSQLSKNASVNSGIFRIKGSNRKKSREVKTVGILAWENPADLSIEALRGLRTSLHFAMLEAKNNILMLSGPSPMVGKSFVSVNLAAVCVQSGQKVLLIDADLRRGHLHSIFGDENKIGLTECLAGKNSVDEIVRESSQDGLDFIARGSVPPNPSELLMHSNCEKLLEKLRSEYDLIVIDTPPVLAVTDVQIIGQYCGTSLLIVRHKVNSLKEITRTVQQLDAAGVSVKGTVLNAIERSAATVYEYGYHNYSYDSEET